MSTEPEAIVQHDNVEVALSTKAAAKNTVAAAPAAAPTSTKYTLPGANLLAYVMLPLRFVVWLLLFSLMYPLLTLLAFFRAVFMRLKHGAPSKILKYGTLGNTANPDEHYPGHQIYKEPLDEPKLRAALVDLCSEADNIEEDDIALVFEDEEPNDWPEDGNWDADYFIPSNKGSNYWYFLMSKAGEKTGKKKGKKVRIHVFNAKQPGRPTIMFFGGSGNAWDGSSNFNFIRELMNRYAGNPPNKVFQKPELNAEAAAKLDKGSFTCFLLRIPINVAKNWGGLTWNMVRAFKWAGGNGFGFKITAMNLSKEESQRLYHGAKAMGMKPFAVFTYAAVKACREVLKQSPVTITQQASLQTRHYPIKDPMSIGDGRSLVGDWLFGPVQYVPAKYGPAESQSAYKALLTDLADIGEATRRSFWAKAYGVLNSGAAAFELIPTYNDDMHVFDRCIFMNNYGVRTIDESTPFHTYNWNAPLWFGVNTINVNGCTTTFVGSAFWGQKVVNALRNNMRATLDDIMAKAPAGSLAAVPKYEPKHDARVESA